MTSIRKKTIMIATLAAILSMTTGFMPQAEAIPLTLNLGLICGVIVPGALIALTGGPTFVGSFPLTNTGNGVQPLLANIGLGWFGAETPTPILHLGAATTTLQVPLSGAGGPVGPVAMDPAAGGTDVAIANLVGGPETVSISVDGASPINPPASGELSTTLTVTADSGQCFTFIA